MTGSDAKKRLDLICRGLGFATLPDPVRNNLGGLQWWEFAYAVVLSTDGAGRCRRCFLPDL